MPIKEVVLKVTLDLDTDSPEKIKPADVANEVRALLEGETIIMSALDATVDEVVIDVWEPRDA